MSGLPTFRAVRFRNFKTFPSYSVPLRDMNVLVGPNNSGKSTIIGAFRILEAALRRARSRSPEFIRVGKATRIAWPITPETVPVSLENVHTNYESCDTAIDFELSDRRKLILHFPPDGGCSLLCESESKTPRTAAEFKAAFPVAVSVVPVLGPVEHDEALVSQETVRLGLTTHRASRHFRSYWHYFPDDFDKFAALVRATWPGMEIKRPEPQYGTGDPRIHMFCSENRIDRELYWSGFGFQVWCQLLTHVIRSDGASILAVDEPEIYLHPDLQRQLFNVLTTIGVPVVMGTHSTEIVSDADPSQVLLVDRSKRMARRLRDPDDAQSALDLIGSSHNFVLTRLSRQRKLLFVEGDYFQLLRRFAVRLGLDELSRKLGLVDVPVGGFGNWARVKALAWGFENALDSKFSLSAIFDRDYRCSAEIESVLAELRGAVDYAHILEQKEIENYLLAPVVLERALSAARREAAQRGEKRAATSLDVVAELETITSAMKAQVMSKYIGAAVAFQRPSGKDFSTVAEETLRWFESEWAELPRRLRIVPGKEVLAALNTRLQAATGVSLSSARIVSAFSVAEVPEEIRSLCNRIDLFRRGEKLLGGADG